MLGEKHFCEAGLLLSNTLSFLCVHQLLYYYSQKQLLLESAIGFNEMNRVAKSSVLISYAMDIGHTIFLNWSIFNLAWGCFYKIFQKTILRSGVKKTNQKKTCLYFWTYPSQPHPKMTNLKRACRQKRTCLILFSNRSRLILLRIRLVK